MQTMIKYSEYIRPRLELLTPDQIRRIHRSSVKILEHTGIKVESKEARRIFWIAMIWFQQSVCLWIFMLWTQKAENILIKYGIICMLSTVRAV